MIRDRGTIKWTSLMLPEHVQLLKDLWEEEGKEKRPIIDEQMLKIMEKKILNSYQLDQPICVKYYDDGKITSIKDQVDHIYEEKKQITFKNGTILSIANIVSIS